MIDKINAEADAIGCGKDEKIKALEELLKIAIRERDEALAYAERLRVAAFVMLVNRTGNDEWYALENAISEQPPASLAALKAQWQAEAVRDFEAMLSSFPVTAEDWIEQRAQEAVDEQI